MPKNYAQIASTNVVQNVLGNIWTKVRHRKQKSSSPNLQKIELEKKRIIFWRANILPQKSEADLMLVLNKTLQQANLPSHIRFCEVSYSQSGAISGLLTKRSNAEEVLKDYSTTLIRTAKSVDEGVIRIEALERWHRLKVHGMPLMRYLREGKIELLCREIESTTRIILKTIPQWLINQEHLEERLESGDVRDSIIVITVGSKVEALNLCAKGFRFGEAPKVLEKNWEAESGSVCMTYSRIGHD